MFETIDNRTKLLGDDLKVELKKGSKVRIAASCFSMYAYKELKKELSEIQDLKFLFTSPTFTKDKFSDDIKKEKREFFIPKQNRENSLYGSEFEIKLRNEMTLKAIAKECSDWVKTKTKFKSNSTKGTIPNLIGIERPDGTSITYNPIDGFTTSDLGYQESNNIFTAINKTDFAEQSKYLFSMFDEVWNDKEKVEDITDTVIEMMGNAYQENSPEFIYFIILYNIFSEFLDDISEDNMPNEATGFKETKLWNMLYDFQKDGVISIINKLEKHNGCILADSVGLGKTFTALAVILYYSLKNRSILVLCPKRLSDNWNQYSGNKRNNPFYNDRIRYDVLYHTDLGRAGHSNGVDLRQVNWGNYDLVVIDESHNFRNNNPVKDKESRYDFMINRIMKDGVNTKVLMLSATPVNNRYNDLKNQLALAYCGDYEGFEKSLDTNASIGQIFRQAQAVFNTWSKLPPENRSNKELIENLSIDFKILLDSVTIARSRKNIEKYYNISEIGKFPKRRRPISIQAELTDIKDLIEYSEIYQSIKQMSLSVYAPFDRILDSKKSYYENLFDIEIKGSALTSKKKHRDSGIKRLMTVNLLKRLESSVEAFRITMNNLLNTNKGMLNRVEHYLSTKEDTFIIKAVFDYESFDQDEDGSLNLAQTSEGKDVRINLKDVDCISWKRDIESDINVLNYLLDKLGQITPEHDIKLTKLKEIISNKIENPINAGNKKVLIFSAFADTARYLYKNIEPWLKEKYGLFTAKVEGGTGKNECSLNVEKSTDTLLTMFSPISKNRDVNFNVDTKISGKKNAWSLWGEDAMEDIDCLIGTDCISEGQNLQDSDMCINYDIHWNPVRIVQRFGRIDRLGSRNDEIQLINFWPAISLDEYIRLSSRVESRMIIVDQAATGDDNLLNPDDEIDDYRSQQIKKMQVGDYEDIEESESGISISDLGLNEFRMDATEFIKIYGEPKRAPKGMHAVISADEMKDAVPGVIYVLRNQNNNVNINRQNMLHPYYLVYVDNDGNVLNTHLEVKQILDIIRSSSKGQASPIISAYQKFNAETQDGLNMKKYNRLLEKSIESIIQVKEQSDLNALFKQGSMVLDGVRIKGLDDFELIAFIVIK